MDFTRLTGYVVIYKHVDAHIALLLGNMAFPTQELAKAAAEKAGLTTSQYTLNAVDFWIPEPKVCEVPKEWWNS